MATRKTTRTTSRGKPAGREGTDAIALLTQDHRNVDKLFKQFDDLKDDEGKIELVEKICNELTAHATAEQEIFYPAARDALGEDGQDLLDEAEVEHASAKELIGQLQEANTDDELFDAKVKVLGEYIRHHVKEEEQELFPKVRESDLDLEALGEDLRTRKEELLATLEAA